MAQQIRITIKFIEYNRSPGYSWSECPAGGYTETRVHPEDANKILTFGQAQYHCIGLVMRKHRTEEALLFNDSSVMDILDAAEDGHPVAQRIVKQASELVWTYFERPELIEVQDEARDWQLLPFSSVIKRKIMSKGEHK